MRCTRRSATEDRQQLPDQRQALEWAVAGRPQAAAPEEAEAPAALAAPEAVPATVVVETVDSVVAR